MPDDEPTVYVNDNPAGGETDVYHENRHCASDLQSWRNDYTRESTPVEAVADGLRPCSNCDPPKPDNKVLVRGDPVDPDRLAWQTVTKKPVDVQATHIGGDFEVLTMEGVMSARDAWLVRGTQGELYPVDSDVFAETFVPDPTKVPKHTDEDVLALVRDVLDEMDDAVDGFRAGMEHAVDLIEDRLLDYDDVDVDLQGDQDG